MRLIRAQSEIYFWRYFFLGTICTADPVNIFRGNITQGEKINEKKLNKKLRNYRVLGQVPGAAGSIGEKRRKADSDRISVYPLT